MDRWMGMLSLCRKAGKLRIGFESVREAAEKGEARLVLYAADFSPRSRRRMENALAQCGAPPGSRTVEATMQEFARVCGKQAGVVAVADEGFAAGMEKLLCDQTKEEQNR